MKLNDCDKPCICVHCQQSFPHEKGHPCRENKCPTCGKSLMREGSYHHELYLKKKKDTNHHHPTKS
jgi:NAD-dependent SIR2 family protein deacetylase